MNDSKQKQSLVLAEYYFRSNNYEFAEHILNTIVKLDANNSKANELLAYIHGNRGDFDACHRLLEKSCSDDACSPEALYYLGSSQLKKHQFENAKLSLIKSIQKAGPFFESLLELGNTYSHLGKTQEALNSYLDCLKFKKKSYELHFNIARALDDLERYDEALPHYDQVIQLKPNFAEAWLNKGVTLHDLKRHNEALHHYDQAIKLKPNFAEAWLNKGNTLKELKRYDEALFHYDQAIKLEPNLADSYFNKSLTLLTLGDFNNGWNLYNFRWNRINADKYRHNSIEELKSLGNLINKKILIWHEQGYGDTIQFSRYIPKLIELGAHVTFEVQPPLLNIFPNGTNLTVTSRIEEISKFDFQAPLMALPGLFNTKIDNIPNPTLIQITPEDIYKWKIRLNLSDKKLNIGLAISGSTTHQNDSNRSIKLSDISPLFNYGNFFIIQKENKNIDNLKLDNSFKFLGDQINDFTDTASIIMNMDLIISVDTSLIHLAGSLNKQSYLMLPWNPEWRWLLDRSDSPWYQSIKIFRQKSFADWSSVVHDIKNELSVFSQQSLY